MNGTEKTKKRERFLWKIFWIRFAFLTLLTATSNLSELFDYLKAISVSENDDKEHLILMILMPFVIVFFCEIIKIVICFLSCKKKSFPLAVVFAVLFLLPSITAVIDMFLAIPFAVCAYRINKETAQNKNISKDAEQSISLI